MQRRQRTVYLVTIAAMIALIGGYALAATTVTTIGTPQSSNVTGGGTPGGFSSIATVTSEQLVVLSAAMSGATAAGTQGTALGLSGTTTALAACGAAACPAQSFRAASPVATTGDYGEQIVLSAFQSTANSAIGFDMAITIVTSTTTIVGFAYFEMPTGGTETIPVFIFVDLGATAPIIDSVSVVFNQCSSGTSCP